MKNTATAFNYGLAATFVYLEKNQPLFLRRRLFFSINRSYSIILFLCHYLYNLACSAQEIIKSRVPIYPMLDFCFKNFGCRCNLRWERVYKLQASRFFLSSPGASLKYSGLCPLLRPSSLRQADFSLQQR